MTRLPQLIAAMLIAAPLAAAPALAQAPTMQAEFAAPFEQNQDVIVDGRMWSCTGNACTARADDPRPAVACRKLARKLGPVTRFATAQTELNAAGLATCNQDRK